MRVRRPAMASHPGEQLRDLRGTVRVCVLRQHAPAGRLADLRARAPASSRSRCAATSSPFGATSTSRAGLEEQLDALPRVGDEAGARAGGLEHARRRREAVAGHALAVDVQHGARRAVEGVVVAREHVARVAHVRRHRLVVPAAAAEQEPAIGRCAAARAGRTPRRAPRGRAAGCRETPRSASNRGSGGDREVRRRARTRCRRARTGARRARGRRRRPDRRRRR